MNGRFQLFITTSVFVLVSAVPASAQVGTQAGVLYKLDKGSTYQHGCFAPCMCPVLETASLRGTFRLVPAGVDPLFQHYDVLAVSWQAQMADGTVLPVAGSGTFKLGGEVAIQEQLALDLALGSDAAQHFDSGLVVPTVPFPVLDLTISLHGVYCFDTVFHVRARPMPRLAVDCGEVRWDPDSAPARYDLVRGDLETLRETGGDYQVATDECVASGVTAESIPYSVSPAPGGAYWFLQRTVGDSYDAYDTALAEPRDAGIDGSPVSCP